MYRSEVQVYSTAHSQRGGGNSGDARVYGFHACIQPVSNDSRESWTPGPYTLRTPVRPARGGGIAWSEMDI